MSIEQLFNQLARRIEELERFANNLDRRHNNVFREAKVLETYPEDGTYVVQAFGEESKSKRLPMFQQSGAIKDFVPMSVGQHVLMISPGGDPGKAFLLPGGYTNDFAQPHDKGDEAKRTVGDASDLMTGGKRLIEVGGSSMSMDGGAITLTTGSGHLA